MAEVEAGDWFEITNPIHVAWLSRCIRRRVGRGGQFYALRLSNGMPIGLYCLAIEDHPNRPGYAELLDIGIVEAHRRQGHGSRLLQDAEARSREAGLCCIYVSMYAGDANAIAFYQHAGFGVVAEHPGLNGPDDRGQMFMRKDLGQQPTAADVTGAAAEQ